jgi:hypothetical protein
MTPRDWPDLFDLPAPSAPGSRSSEDAADAIMRSPFRRASWRKVLNYLASKAKPVSREELSEAIGIPQHVLCARLSELRPTWVEAHDRVCTSRAGLKVDGYALTLAGASKVREQQ